MAKFKEDHLEKLLASFSHFIRIQIHKYDLQRYGIDPDDVAQEIRIKLWKLLMNEKNIDYQTSYIRKIIESTVIDHLRKWKREETSLNQTNMRTIAEKNLSCYSELPSEEKIQELIVSALNCLIDSRKKAVKLFLLNMNIDEIARYYSWSKNKARNLLYRGLNDLKKILKEKSIYYEPKN
ncbi:MAG: RNA polymerase sigma factor [Candidatus Aminicenantes bacterium]|nr:RNA polymerase sigma factor [Candidatus Aminicenantes bacterium]